MALYNKYRPTSLKMVCAQDHIKRILANQVRDNELVHAYLFTGPAGTGKTTVARILASMVNCSTGPCVDPPADDKFVKTIMEGKKFTDVFEMDAASSRGIDDAKVLREMAHNPPMEMAKRIFIIDECHQLSKDAWPVLLKLIEEPPEHVIFILCTTELNKVLETIVTRCQPHQFRPLRVEDIVGYTKNIANLEKIPIEEEALRLIATAARGSLRDALSKLDKVRHLPNNPIKADDVSGTVGVPSRKIIRSYLDAVLSANLAAGLEASAQSIGIGVSPQDFFREVANVCHDLMLATSPGFDLSSSGYGQEEAEALKVVSSKLIDQVGKDQYRPLVRQWIRSVQECSQLTVFNLQPQFQVNVAFVDLFDAYRSAKRVKAQKEKGGTA